MRLRPCTTLPQFGDAVPVEAAVAHEMKAPLGVLAIDIQRLLKREPKGGERAAILQKMQRVVRHLSQIVDNVLTFSRQREPTLVRQPLKPLVDWATQLLSERFRSEKKRLVVRLPGSLPHVEVDSDRLVQVLINLGVNALDAMDRRGSLAISARHRRREHKVEIVFADTGRGLPAGQAERVFEPFFTTKASGAVGLGLAISRSIIESHHGTLHFESAEGKGTTVTIRLPAAAHRRRGSPRGVGTRGAPSPGKKRIVA